MIARRDDIRRTMQGLFVCFAIAFGGAAYGQTAGHTAVDLRAGTFNGRPIVEWTLDAITDSLGRPTAVSPGVAGITGSQLHYHDRGLSLWFQAKQKDPAQHLWMVTIYLARAWDREHTAWYSVFPGTIAPAVDANWKQSRLENEFASLHPVLRTVEESRRETSALGIPGLTGATNDFLSVKMRGFSVSFALEPYTKFLERVALTAADTTR